MFFFINPPQSSEKVVKISESGQLYTVRIKFLNLLFFSQTFSKNIMLHTLWLLEIRLLFYSNREVAHTRALEE